MHEPENEWTVHPRSANRTCCRIALGSIMNYSTAAIAETAGGLKPGFCAVGSSVIIKVIDQKGIKK